MIMKRLIFITARVLPIALLLALTATLAVGMQGCKGGIARDPEKTTIMDKTNHDNNPAYSRQDSTPVDLTDEQWKKILPKDVYQVAREKGTERPWTSQYEKSHEIGTYYCAVCGNPLFKSDTKFESGCGWPSFYEPISKSSIIYAPDHTYGMDRTEVMCGRCKSHLGHVFNDGPPPTGLRYCINGVVLDFAKAQDAEKKYNESNK
jgi:peptide-methionine (R)-S-oxide reductase